MLTKVFDWSNPEHDIISDVLAVNAEYFNSGKGNLQFVRVTSPQLNNIINNNGIKAQNGPNTNLETFNREGLPEGCFAITLRALPWLQFIVQERETSNEVVFSHDLTDLL